MKKWGGISFVVILLVAGAVLTPVVGRTKAGDSNNITIYFWDCTGKKPVKHVLEFTETDWNNLKEKFRNIRTTSDSIEESFDAQFVLFKQYGLINYDMTYQTLQSNAMDRFKDRHYMQPRGSSANNVIINAICAINFQLTSGTTFVFGLNTFINIVGFDIVSFHKGYAVDGIQTKGLLSKSADPGNYTGFMFGLLGYWFGTKTGTGQYSDVIVSGFTVITAWVPMG